MASVDEPKEKAGRHRPGYRRPRTGEPRQTRQPLRIDRLPEEIRQEIQRRRARGETWKEIEQASASFAGERLPMNTLSRWYDLRVEQVQKEVMAQSERARAMAAAFASKGFEDLPEAAVNALSAQVFTLMENKGGAEFEASLGNLVVVLSKLITAQAKQKQVELAEKKFKDLKSNAEKTTHEAAAKLGKGRALTLEDINRLRERTFGLPPIAAGGPPA
jgi:hypothetical protein